VQHEAWQTLATAACETACQPAGLPDVVVANTSQVRQASAALG